MESILTRVARAVGVEPGEERIFAWAAATFFLIHAASVAVANASDTFFLKRIGVNLLPLVLLVSSFLLVLTTAGVARLAARRPQISLLAGIFFALAAALLPLWLVALADVRGVFVVLVVVSKQVESIAALMFWVAAGALLNARQAKRLYAPIVAGGTLGEIVGSFASALIGRSLGIAALLPAAAASLAIAGVLAHRVAAAVPARVTQVRGRRAASRAGSALALFVPLWRDSDLFRILAVSALLCGTLGPLLYFQFAYAADLATRGGDAELRLLSLYAVFRGWLNVAVLALQLVGTARLFRRIGIPLAATLSPIVYLFGFLAVSARLGLGAAVGAMAGASLQDHGVYDPAQQILFTLFPERMRPAATTLIEGPVQRVGGVVGTIIVLTIIALSTPAWIAFAGLPIALLWLAAALLLWRIYPTLLLRIATTRRARSDAGLPLRELIDPGTQRVLASSLTDADPEHVRAACALVTAGPLDRAVIALAGAAVLAPATTRSVVLDALHRLLDRSGAAPGPLPQAANHLEALLDQPRRISGVERARVLEAYARVAPDVRPGSHGADVLARFRQDPEPAVRLAAAARLRDAGALDPGSGELDAALSAALASDDLETRHVALDELRATLLDRRPGRRAGPDHWASSIALLGERLREPSDRARAAEILADLAAHDRDRVVVAADLLPYAADPDARVRAAVLRFVGHGHLTAEIGWVVERLGAADDSEAAAAVEALRALGPLAVNALLDALHRGSRTTRDAVLPILRDLHLEPALLHRLVDREVEQIQRTVLQLYGLASGGTSDAVRQRLSERIGEHLSTVLLLFATERDEDRFVVLGRLLARTRGARGRAVLLEALEALLPPEERARIMPLLDDGTARAAKAAAAALGQRLPSFDHALREAMADSDPLTIAFLAPTRDAPPLAAGADLVDTAPRDGAPQVRMLSRVEIVLHLRGLHLFRGLTMRQLSEIAGLVHEETSAAGAVIVREGDIGECMYLVLSGEVLISRAGQYTLTAGPGELFGEMSIFDGETRLATVSAARRVRLLRLERHDLFELMDEQPAIAIGICQTLARHARDTIKRLEEKAAAKS